MRWLALVLAVALFAMPSHEAVASGRAVNGVQLGAGGGSPIGTNLFVSPAGASSVCSSSAPCALATARAALHGLGTGTINFTGGTYRLASTLALTSAENGQTWQNAVGATPILSGAVQPSSGWTTYSGSIMKASVPSGTNALQLWINENRGVVATGQSTLFGTATLNSTGFAVTNTAYLWPDLGDLRLRAEGAWLDYRCPVSSATSAQINIAAPCFGLWNGGDAGGIQMTQLFYYENALELLTQAGQWYLDVHGYNGPANTLYYWPRPSETISTADVEIPSLTTLMSVSGASGLTLSGLMFEYGTWLPSGTDGVTAVQGAYVYQTVSGSLSNYLQTYTGGGANMAAQVQAANVQITGSVVTVTGCSFEHLGSTALSLLGGSHNSTVSQNTFFDISGSAIVVGDAMHATDESNTDPTFVHDVTVSGNATMMTGQDYWGEPAIQGGYTTNLVVSNNDIFVSAYDGTMIGGFLTAAFSSYATNTVTKNLVHGAMHRFPGDGGAIYFTGKQASGLSSTVSANVADNTTRGPQGILYLDTSTSYSSWIGNVVEDNSAGATCLLEVQPDPSFLDVFNTITGTYSNISGICNPSNPPDPSNTIGAVTNISGVHDSLVAAIVAAAGNYTLRPTDVAYGGSVSTSGGSSSNASQLTDGNFGTLGNGWVCTGTGCTAVVDLGVARSIAKVELAYVWGVATVYSAYTVAVSNDATFATGVTQVGAVDASGTSGTFYSSLGQVENFPVSPAISARYVRIAAATSISLGELFVRGT